jgi:hypothetical protein
MFKTIRFAALVAGASLLAVPALAQDSPVLGKWATAVVTDFGTFNAVMTVAQEGGAYTVNIQDIAPEGGAGAGGGGAMPSTISDVVIDGSKFSFKRKLTTPQGEMNLTYNGTVDGDALTAEVGSDFGPLKLTGTRQ